MIGGLLEHRYRVDRVLARGGMSTVYRGVDTRLDRAVAIKVMDPQFSADRSFVARFEQEARAAARLHHPGIVAVHDQGVDRGEPGGEHVFLIMELIEGGTLRDLISERGTLSTPLALSVLEPVLSALAAAHQAGLVHRDVKPENVLIGLDGRVKVADFGLVRAVASVSTTSDSTILGTVAYLSPEQVATGASDARSDVYSAGIVLYEMLTGVTPYLGDTPISVAYRHVNEDVPAPSTIVPGIPAELDQLVVRATRRDPAQRPADAAAFLAEAERVRAALGVPRMAVPAPAPGQHDQTVRVRPVQAPRDSAAAELTMPVLAAAGAGAATISHRVPGTPGGAGGGPQGTVALNRTAYQPPPAAPPPPKPAAKKRVPRKTAAEVYEEERKRNKRRFILWAGLVALLAVLVGVTAWWMGSGRFTTVPGLIGAEEETAVVLLKDASLKSTFTQEASDTVPKGKVLRTDPAEGTEKLRGDAVKVYISLGKPVVPIVRPGSESADVENDIKKSGLKASLDANADVFSDTVTKGKVVTSKPAPGTEVKLNSTVTIVLSKGSEPKPVPDLTGKTKDEAFAELTSLGFEPVEGKGEPSGNVEGGKVVRTDPPANTTIPAGSSKKVSVILSTAKAQVTVPKVEGQKVKDAKKSLEDLGLQVEVLFNRNSNSKVLNQSIPPNTKVDKGTKITLIAP
ncbi:serine/threonine-protein kinase [Umezawaea tangerina]|uniref:non-specific serine/threonine protein kinase n=1 Tax=Umezawaea tangerina TaxID=84725 RepID=A0A2T0SKS5_9PSEU|nr:Stk1 family PASTA domain-containing Ser/Thr kinase [Umezawaea tangerina]PRY34006.1 serine/threonine-protein kinase [Umezawaea tangerina]